MQHPGRVSAAGRPQSALVAARAQLGRCPSGRATRRLKGRRRRRRQAAGMRDAPAGRSKFNWQSFLNLWPGLQALRSRGGGVANWDRLARGRQPALADLELNGAHNEAIRCPQRAALLHRAVPWQLAAKWLPLAPFL